MSEGEIEVEAVSGYQVLPKEVTEEIGSIKVQLNWNLSIMGNMEADNLQLFNKWSYEDVEIRDISLT